MARESAQPIALALVFAPRMLAPAHIGATGRECPLSGETFARHSGRGQRQLGGMYASCAVRRHGTVQGVRPVAAAGDHAFHDVGEGRG